jgi:hypothetical protein
MSIRSKVLNYLENITLIELIIIALSGAGIYFFGKTFIIIILLFIIVAVFIFMPVQNKG